MSETSFVTQIVDAINYHAGETEAPRSAHEAYAILKQLVETAEATAGKADKLLKELWNGVKEKDDAVVQAFARELSSVGRGAAAAYVQLSSVAMLAEHVES